MRGKGSWPISAGRKKVPNVDQWSRQRCDRNSKQRRGRGVGGVDVAVHHLEPLRRHRLPDRHVHDTVSSLLPRRSCRPAVAQPRIGVERIVDQHFLDCAPAQPVRQDVLAVELPVRIVGREQQELVGADVLDDARQHLRLALSAHPPAAA